MDSRDAIKFELQYNISMRSFGVELSTAGHRSLSLGIPSASDE